MYANKKKYIDACMHFYDGVGGVSMEEKSGGGGGFERWSGGSDGEGVVVVMVVLVSGE